MSHNTMGVRTSDIMQTAFKPSPGMVITAGRTAVQKKYDALGGEKFFGELERDEFFGDRYFKNGSCLIYNSRLKEAFLIKGAIYRKWQELGGTKWGLPSTDELPTSRGDGFFNFFNNGSASIHWSPNTGAHAVQGAILQKWAQLNWENGPLGYPVTDETTTPDGIGRFNHFEKMVLYIGRPILVHMRYLMLSANIGKA